MKLRKIIISVAMIMVCSSTVSAEQPAADEYRGILESGQYCVEYSLRSYNFKTNSIKPSKDDPKEISGRLIVPPTAKVSGGNKVSIDLFSGKYEFLGTGIDYIMINDKSQRIKKWRRKIPAPNASIPFLPVPIKVKDASTLTEPVLMYKDGNYYRFSCGDNAMAVMHAKADKDITAVVLPEGDLYSPELDPTEGWYTIRMQLSLPDEFAPFVKADSFRDSENPLPVVTLMSSYQTEVAKEQYDCDAYKAQDGAEYYALYKDGELKLVQKFVNKDGVDELTEELFVRKISREIPEDAFVFEKEIPLYGAGMGDANDFLGIPVKVGVLGGAVDAS